MEGQIVYPFPQKTTEETVGIPQSPQRMVSVTEISDPFALLTTLVISGWLPSNIRGNISAVEVW